MHVKDAVHPRPPRPDTPREVESAEEFADRLYGYSYSRRNNANALLGPIGDWTGEIKSRDHARALSLARYAIREDLTGLSPDQLVAMWETNNG